jgi:DNA-binding response OmpR family regulator
MKPTVMIVEDEDALSTLLQYNLDKEGYTPRAMAKKHLFSPGK